MNVKHLAVSVVLAAATLAAQAEGYQINTLSARQNGMGHTGTALKLGAESMIFNPAGLAFEEHAVDFQGSVTAIFAHGRASVLTSDMHSSLGPVKTDYTTSQGPSTPLAFNLGMKVFDNFAAGVSFYTPYGSGITWGDNWPGAVLNQSVDLKAFTVQPTLAWKILPNLSIGAGAMITWGNVDLNKGLVTPESVNMLMNAMNIPGGPFKDTPASINLNGSAATTVGFNVGAMWDITSQWTVGVSYRSKMNLKVKSGDATLRYANEMAQNVLQSSLNVLNEANFTAEMPAPAVLNFGVAYHPTDKWTFAADAQLTFWNVYKKLEIDFLSETLKAYNQNITKDYHNSWTVRLGAQYKATERLDLRAGMMIDTTPVNEHYYNPETPGMTKIEPSVGFSFSPVKNFAIDASLLYVAGLGKDNASCSYPDLIATQIAQKPVNNTFMADYKVHSWCPAIGFRVNF